MDALWEMERVPYGLRRRRDLRSLIELYESNYLRFLRLAPALHRIEEAAISRVAGALDLHLVILERSKYTTTVSLSYHFVDERHFDAEPNAQIRVYHDVHAVELLSHWRRRHGRGMYRRRSGYMPELNRRWTMNRFLYKWLRFCTHQGHLFLGDTAHSEMRGASDS